MAAKKKTAGQIRKQRRMRVRARVRENQPELCAISVEYNGGLWRALDQFLSQVAKNFGGKNVGSGYGFHDGSRDLRFEFPSHRERGEFLVAVRQVASVFVTSLRDYGTTNE